MIEGIAKMVRNPDPMRAGFTIEEPTIHDLFNELHRRLQLEAENTDYIILNQKLNKLATKVDALHHDYAELTS